jgi:hypothetical protein
MAALAAERAAMSLLYYGKQSTPDPEFVKTLTDPETRALFEQAQIQAQEQADRAFRENLWFSFGWFVSVLVGLGFSIVIWDALRSFLFGR